MEEYERQRYTGEISGKIITYMGGPDGKTVTRVVLCYPYDVYGCYFLI